MSDQNFQVQILDKSDHSKQFLVSVPAAQDALTAGAIRIQSRILSVTSNTFLYARLGDLLHWWDVWAPIPSLSAPFNDQSQYGRISSWGYAEVTESMFDKVFVGTKLWGYLPIGNYPEILEVDIDEETGHLTERSERRKPLMNLYNRYIPLPPGVDFASNESLGWDSVMKVIFETSYLLNRYAFAWDAKHSHPMGIPAPAPWSVQDADLKDAVVLLLAPSGKTGLSFAHQLRNGRPVEFQPRKVIAIGSAESYNFSMDTGLFNRVMLYSDFKNLDVGKVLGIERDTKVLLVNFGARGEADTDWHTALKPLSKRLLTLFIGSDPKKNKRSNLAALSQDPRSGVVRGNASTLRDFAMKVQGQSKYFEDLEQAWAGFKASGTVPGLKLQWGTGMGELEDGWNALCNGEVSGTVGQVYKL